MNVVSTDSIVSTDVAWLAGFIDGEGTIMLYLNEKGGGPNPTRGATFKSSRFILHSFTIGNTNVDNMRRTKAIVSAIVGREVRYTVPDYRRTGGYRPVYKLALSRATELETLIRALLPYLVGKRPQAELMLEYLALGPAGGQTPGPIRGYTDAHFAFVPKMRALNKTYAKGEWKDEPPANDRTASPHEGEETV